MSKILGIIFTQKLPIEKIEDEKKRNNKHKEGSL